MTLDTECAPFCAALKKLNEQRRAIEERRAVRERLGVNTPEQDAQDARDLRDLDTKLVPLRQFLAAMGCNCNDDDDAAGSASPVLNPASPGSNP